MPNPKGYNQYKRGPGASGKAKATRKGPTAADAMALKAKYPNLPIGGVPSAGFSVPLKSTTVPPKPRKPKNAKKATPKPKTAKAKPKAPRRSPTRADAIALKAKYPNLPITVGR